MMKYLIRGDKYENTDSIKEYIEAKLSRLDKYIKDSDDIEAIVLTKKEGRRYKIEVTIPTKDFTLRNEVVDDDLYAAIDLVIDKLERQVRKNKEKLNKKKKVIEDFEIDIEDNFMEEEVIVKRKSIELKPIDEEEAILQMELLGHNFFVYKDIETDKICVLYKRKNGNYGIIETK
ncbi:MAG: ribosome-associated translation inhibitor RaiA [Bacilli bacterium]|nr:ribosome-associated translation inhibitor RaiA [Bacilli bacterium]MBR4830416.1 ribosome-associated translation inhibitor RaiA [Bacilli bacterium]